MESSRSGLLSTLLMTLPLIVVPAIALLRPPGQVGSVATTPLAATDRPDDELLEEFDLVESDSERTSSGTAHETDLAGDEFEELFAESPLAKNSGASEVGDLDKSAPMNDFDNELSNPFDLEDPPETAPEETPASGTIRGTDKIVEELNVLGALRTMWFDAGQKNPVGFAVFFRGQTELTRIRFEAVGQSREQCARNVLNQVRKWQAAQTGE